MIREILAAFFILLSFGTETARANGFIACSGCAGSGMQLSPLCTAGCGPQTFPTVPTWGMPQLPYCPQCMANNPGLYEAQPMNNWWMPYAPNYWNFYMPGPYNGTTMMPNYFPQPPYQPPGGQGVYLAKPVVYFRGPKGAKIEVTLNPGKGEVLVAVPALNKWKAEIQGNRLKTAEGKYDFFFYDAWVDHNGLQDQQGFCGDRKEILSYMETSLKQLEFPKEAILDFRSTWAIKLPQQQQLCVFPQTEDHLKSGIELKFKPAKVHLTQLEFIVVAKKFFGSAAAKNWKLFTQEPKSEFAFRKVASVAGNSKDTIRAFDWGVGFLRGDK